MCQRDSNFEIFVAMLLLIVLNLAVIHLMYEKYHLVAAKVSVKGKTVIVQTSSHEEAERLAARFRKNGS